jgi:hypothetical protein
MMTLFAIFALRFRVLGLQIEHNTVLRKFIVNMHIHLNESEIIKERQQIE